MDVCPSPWALRGAHKANDRAAPNRARARLLAAAATARRRAIAPCRAFAGIVEFLPAKGLHRLVRETHHRIGEACAPVLRDRGTRRRRDEQEEAKKEPHIAPPTTTP
jgi:hypothetical protein